MFQESLDIHAGQLLQIFVFQYSEIAAYLWSIIPSYYSNFHYFSIILITVARIRLFKPGICGKATTPILNYNSEHIASFLLSFFLTAAKPD